MIIENKNKDIAQRFGDMIAAADSKPLIPYHPSERRCHLFIGTEDRAFMLEAMAQIHCRHVEFGTYECYDETKLGFCVDFCLVPEINRLNEVEGIKTVGCCCGHGRQEGYIQVAPEWLVKMKELGYEQLPLDSDGNGHWCFKPKTSLPKPSTVLAPVCKSEVEKLKEAIEFLEDENLKLRKQRSGNRE